MSTPLEMARAAWGMPLPDWIEVLAQKCGASSQKAVAMRLGYSGSLIGLVLRKTYPGDVAKVEEAVRGAFMGSTVNCPARGVLPTDQCVAWRRKAQKYHPTNAERVRMFKACGRCPRGQKGGEL